MNPLSLIRLKNGSEEPHVLVAAAMISLKNLIGDDPISFYELVMKARDPNHRVFSQHQINVLTGLSLMEPSGNLHQSITNVVLSAVSGEGLGLSIGDPVAR